MLVNLHRASRDARYLGLVPIEDFVERRNDEVIEYFSTRRPNRMPPSRSSPYLLCRNRSPRVACCGCHVRLITNLQRPMIDQRYHVELWAEKTTVNDVLLGLARRLRSQRRYRVGEISVTACYAFVQRAKNVGRPVRILYVSTSIRPGYQSRSRARGRSSSSFAATISILISRSAGRADPCAVRRISPAAHPIKETENRAAKFEARYGEGATELDALEALRPGLLRRSLRRKFAVTTTVTLMTASRRQAQAFRRMLKDAHDGVIDRYADEFAAIESDYGTLCGEVNPHLGAIADRFAARFADIAERHNALQQTIAAELEEEAPDPSDEDWPEPDDGDEDADPLFDSTREYVEQIDRFKKHQGSRSRAGKERRLRHEGRPGAIAQSPWLRILHIRARRLALHGDRFPICRWPRR